MVIVSSRLQEQNSSIMVAERSTGSVLVGKLSSSQPRAAMARSGTPGSDRDGRSLREQLDDVEIIDHEDGAMQGTG